MHSHGYAYLYTSGEMIFILNTNFQPPRALPRVLQKFCHQQACDSARVLPILINTNTRLAPSTMLELVVRSLEPTFILYP
jgi:hypothetical protein